MRTQTWALAIVSAVAVVSLMGCTPPSGPGATTSTTVATSSTTSTTTTSTTTLPSDPHRGETLDPGEWLFRGQYLRSPSGQFRLEVGFDGNVTLWAYASHGGSRRAKWSTGTTGSAAERLEMQPDGNLVVYTAARQPLWNSGTSGQPNNHLRLQDDSNLVIWNTAGQVAWQSGPSHDTLTAGEDLEPGWSIASTNGLYRLLMQTNGRLTLIENNAAVWTTPTEGHFDARLRMQPDGNLVIYASSGVPVWTAPGTFGRAVRLLLQNDRNLVAYDANGAAAWSSGTLAGGPPPTPSANTYPYSHAQPYNVNNYDWWIDENGNGSPNVPGELISPLGYYYRNCTDYAAWKLKERGVPASTYQGLGNANTWDDRAAARGGLTTSTPQAGDIAVWNTGTFGHVAYVHSVNPDGTVTVSDYNKGGDGNFRGPYNVSRSNPSVYVRF